MNRLRQGVQIFLTVFLATALLRAEDYRLIVTYPNAGNPWGRRLASGENKMVMKIQFIDLDADNDYKITQFSVRPFTDQDIWYIDSLQLWKNTDNYPGSLNRNTDSLINTQSMIGLDVAVTNNVPIAFTLGSELILGDTTTFFVTMIARNWFTEYPEDREISTQNGSHIGITVSKDGNDIVILQTDDNPAGTSNAWSGDESKYFIVRAVNLPVHIYNRNHTAEEDSNMFYANYYEIDGSDSSKNQIISDLTIAAHVFLPFDGSVNGDSLSYASFKVGWNNQYLQLDSIAFGDLWDGKQYQEEGWDESGYGESTLPGDSTLSVVRFEAVVMGNSTSPENYVDIANNSLGIFYFKVLKPGVSPLFLSDIHILDQWGIPYHCYRRLQNDADDTARKYDAWSKQILGDFAGAEGTLTNGECDGAIDPVYDVTLFADYFWMNADSADWYARFDIGDSSSHDPDVLSPDDTTNFYDLIVIGTNYYRTLRGDFSQKAVAYSGNPGLVFGTVADRENAAILQYRVDLKNIPQLVSAQLKFYFNPAEYSLKDLSLGQWVTDLSSENVLLYPQKELAKGIVDVNFLALGRPLSGDGAFLTISFEQNRIDPDPVQLAFVDLRDVNSRKIAVNIDASNQVQIISDHLLVNCFPNPFNPSMTIRYSVPEGHAGNFQLSIFDMQGKLIRELTNTYHAAGNYRIDWDGLNRQNSPVSSGIYFIRVKGNGISRTEKISLIR